MREVICTGPKPPPGDQFCVMCALRFKAESLELPDVQEDIQALMRDDGPPLEVNLVKLGKGRIHLPALSVALGVCQPLGGVIVPLCWGHLQAVKFSAVAPASPADMVGPNGAPLPLLGGKR